MNFGVISPKIKTAMVITAVDTTADVLPSLISVPKKIVASVVAERFTMLLPISIVEISLSYLFSARSKTFLAFLFPFVTSERSFMRFAHE